VAVNRENTRYVKQEDDGEEEERGGKKKRKREEEEGAFPERIHGFEVLATSVS